MTEDEGDMTHRNVGNLSPSDAASHRRRPESLVPLVFSYGWMVKICEDVGFGTVQPVGVNVCGCGVWGVALLNVTS